MTSGPQGASAAPSSPARLAWSRFITDAPARTGLAIVASLVLFALFGPLVVGRGPDASDFSLTRDAFGAPPGPSAAHWLGTDALFRDLVSRLASGARVSLLVAIGATALSTVVGALAGLAAGWVAGGPMRAIDALVMRIVDVLLALPFLLCVTAIGAAVGRTDVGTLVLVLGLSGWTATARLVRAETLELRGRDFVAAARALGAKPSVILLRHVLPNVAGLLLVLATSLVGQMILAEAVLSYLTVGVQPPRATWGRMLHEAEPYLASRPSLAAAPALAILLSVIGLGRVGDGLRRALQPNQASSIARRWPFDLAIAGAVVLFTAAASPDRPAPPRTLARDAILRPIRGGTLRVASHLNLRTLDPALANDEVADAIGQLVFARLVTWDREGRIVPDLADSVRVSTDGTTYTFELEPRVLFQDGHELTAADVKRSMERTLAKGTPSPGASHYGMLKGFDVYRTGKAPDLAGVRVLGDHTVAFDLEAPDATFLARMTLAFAAPVCPSMGAKVDPRNPMPPCGAGPFRVVSFEPDKGVELSRHDGYFKPGKPYLDAIRWSTNVRSQTQRYLLEDGSLDYTRDLTATDAALFRGDAAWSGQFRTSSRLSTTAVFLDTEMPPFDRRDVRRAVALALDPSVLERIRPDVKEVDRILPAALDAGAPKGTLRRHDEAAALAAMAAAGFAFDPATGRGGYPQEIEYVAVPDTWDQQVGEIWQQQLARVGLRLRLRLVAYAAFLAEVSRRKTVAMGTTGWNADFPDPSNFFEPTLGSSAIADEGSQNVAFFSNAELDAALDRGRRAASPEARREAYARAEEIVASEAPWVPTYTTRVFEIWQPRLLGYEPHPLLPEDLRDVWVSPEVTRGLAKLEAPFFGSRARRSRRP